MARFFILFVCVLCSGALPLSAYGDDALPELAKSKPVQNPVILDDAAMAQEVERLNKAVRAIRTLRGHFVQNASNGGVQTGTFYWKRPDKLRIEYDSNPMLIVADGSNIAQIDKDLETIDQIRIGWTPYKFLLARKFDLAKGAELVGLRRMENMTLISVRDLKGKLDGEFTLVFREPDLTFLGWIWSNPFDGQVTFTLDNVVRDKKMKSSLFVIRESERRRGGRRH